MAISCPTPLSDWWWILLKIPKSSHRERQESRFDQGRGEVATIRCRNVALKTRRVQIKKSDCDTFNLPAPSLLSWFRFCHSSLGGMRHAVFVAGGPLLGSYPGFGIHSPMGSAGTPHSFASLKPLTASEFSKAVEFAFRKHELFDLSSVFGSFADRSISCHPIQNRITPVPCSATDIVLPDASIELVIGVDVCDECPASRVNARGYY